MVASSTRTPGELGGQQLLDRQPAAPVRQPDDDPVDVLLGDDAPDVGGVAEHVVVPHDFSLALVDEADQAIGEVLLSTDLPGQHARGVAGADDQHALFEMQDRERDS